MKEYPLFDTTVQNEALINEFKGNLFEYLVGHQISRHYGIEEQFITSFNGEIRRQLTQYEYWLRKNRPDLLKKLPVLAQQTAQQLLDHLPPHSDQLLVLGKLASASSDNLKKEADLMLMDKGVRTPISLKLCKDNSFVNTKSGGVESFISKYFSTFSAAQTHQENLSRRNAESFWQMGFELYEMAGLDFSGSFDAQWDVAGYSHLPGQLDSQMKKNLHAHYHRVITQMYTSIKEFFQADPELFAAALFPLLGLGDSCMVQAICYHSGAEYALKRVEVVTSSDLDDKLKESLMIGQMRPTISSFEIHIEGEILQIRVKPMNKFTTSGLKINCSVKRGRRQ